MEGKSIKDKFFKFVNQILEFPAVAILHVYRLNNFSLNMDNSICIVDLPIHVGLIEMSV